MELHSDLRVQNIPIVCVSFTIIHMKVTGFHASLVFSPLEDTLQILKQRRSKSNSLTVHSRIHSCSLNLLL